ncbi:MAG: hypothetical protein FJX22_00390 [Alphaproteobacteria bacterium]|nr:hypothetical protein [Alphaproteobacteria bacterium]
MFGIMLPRPAQATEGANSCVDSPLFNQITEVSKGLDDAQTLYHQYLQWVQMAQNRSAWQQVITDHRAAVQELNNRKVAVINTLTELYSNGDVAFQTGADGNGYNYSNGRFHKGVKPLFPSDSGGEDGTDWNDLINDERAKMSETLATYIAGIADADARASLRYCGTAAPGNPASTFYKGYLGLVRPNFCVEEVQECTTAAVTTPAPRNSTVPTIRNNTGRNGATGILSGIGRGGVFAGGGRFDRPIVSPDDSSDSVDGDATVTIGEDEGGGNATPPLQTCVCVAREKPNCIQDWAQSFGGLVYQWNEQRKKELDLRGQSVQAMRSLDEINELKRSLQQAMTAQGATGVAGNLADEDLKAKFLAFFPGRYTSLYNRLGTLRQNTCARMALRPLTELYQRVTAEARQYDVALLPSGEDAGSTLVDTGKMVDAVRRATNLNLQAEDFANMRQGNCGPTASCVENDDQNRCQRYMYDTPSTIAWAQQNASAIAGNKAKFRQLTCGDATYPLP